MNLSQFALIVRKKKQSFTSVNLINVFTTWELFLNTKLLRVCVCVCVSRWV